MSDISRYQRERSEGELMQQREAYARYGNPPPPPPFRLSDEDVDRIARAVVQLLRDVAGVADG